MRIVVRVVTPLGVERYLKIVQHEGHSRLIFTSKAIDAIVYPGPAHAFDAISKLPRNYGGHMHTDVVDLDDPESQPEPTWTGPCPWDNPWTPEYRIAGRQS